MDRARRSPTAVRGSGAAGEQAFFTQLAMPALSPEDIAAVRQRFESVRTQHYPFDFGPTDHHVENRDLLAAPKYHVLFKLWKKEGAIQASTIARFNARRRLVAGVVISRFAIGVRKDLFGEPKRNLDRSAN